MALSVNDITTRAGIVLNDIAAVRYTNAELVGYISDGQRRVCALIPSAYSLTFVNTLPSAGAMQPLPTLVPLPTGGFGSATRLLSVICNVIGTANGTVIRPIDRQTLDDANPAWPGVTGTTILHSIYDHTVDPYTFWIYPGAATAASQKIRMACAIDPPNVSAGGQVFIDPLYHEPLIDYVVARAFSKDADYGDELNQAQFHAQAFFSAIGAGKTDDAKQPAL
jgi:hypothetical protein